MSIDSALEKILPKNKTIRSLVFLFGDILLIFVSAILALLIRFEFIIGDEFNLYFSYFKQLFPYFCVSTIAIFHLMKMYSTMWSVASIREAVMIFISCILVDISYIIIAAVMEETLPRSFYILFPIIFYAFEMILRFSYRISRMLTIHKNNETKRIMIVGAGEAGAQLLREIRTSSHLSGKVMCFIDDNEYKDGKLLNGVKIYCGRDKIEKLSKTMKIDEIYIAMPAASAQSRKEIIEIASKTSCKVKVLPGIYQLANGEVTIAKLRDIDIEDLLGRDEVKVNLDEILSFIQDKVVLVTGAGGSIGSEICRQIASHSPKKLIMIDIYENSVYDIQNELKFKYPDLNLEVLIASVRDAKRMDDIFETYKPNIIFHAAAHKHVPLMEMSPCEAVKNNCIGTYNTAKAASKNNAEKFILISTDKAVNPTNIMGASKRICEMVVQYMSRHSSTNFALVRFGNVLGSNGSVIPLFKKQIENGGPVTVTHPEITRYFMTIPEAVALVLQAGAYATGGEVFVLDMGKPVKIVEMAKNLISLAGYEPNVDIKIEYTGLRPGEKLYEELLMAEEGLKETNNKLIHIGKALEFDDDKFINDIDYIDKAANNNDKNIKEKVANLVPNYTVDKLSK